MKLTYRGVSCDDQLLILQVEQGEVGGQYRGKNWRYQYPRHIPQVQPRENLRYRGLTMDRSPLSCQRRGIGEPEQAATPNWCSVSIRPSQVLTSHEMTQRHLAHLHSNLERRLQVAKAKGDNQLVALLNHESQQLAIATP